MGFQEQFYFFGLAKQPFQHLEVSIEFDISLKISLQFRYKKQSNIDP